MGRAMITDSADGQHNDQEKGDDQKVFRYSFVINNRGRKRLVFLFVHEQLVSSDNLLKSPQVDQGLPRRYGKKLP